MPVEASYKPPNLTFPLEEGACLPDWWGLTCTQGRGAVCVVLDTGNLIHTPSAFTSLYTPLWLVNIDWEAVSEVSSVVGNVLMYGRCLVEARGVRACVRTSVRVYVCAFVIVSSVYVFPL